MYIILIMKIKSQIQRFTVHKTSSKHNGLFGMKIKVTKIKPTKQYKCHHKKIKKNTKE